MQERVLEIRRIRSHRTLHPGTAAARKTEELLNRRISDLAERHPELAARIS